MYAHLKRLLLLLAAVAALTLAAACSGGDDQGKTNPGSADSSDSGDAKPSSDSATPADSKSGGDSSSGSGDAKPSAAGTLVADLGFRPNKDGYKFENFGNKYATTPGTLTMNEVRQMFGDGAACETGGTSCVPNPGAKLFLDAANKSSNGGHCEGFAVTSLRLFQNKDSASEFGAGSTHELSIDGNDALRHYIARYMASQMVEPVAGVAQSYQKMTPKEILQAIIANMKDGKDPFTMGIYKKGGGGHAIVPYAVADKGDGKFWVMIYDNNWPDIERHIEIDVNANTWKYDLAATNPDVPAEPWEGDATSFSLDLTPQSSRDGEYVCPWCGAKNLAGRKSTAKQDKEILFSGDGNLTVTDKQGRKLTYINGQMQSSIPGAGVTQSRLRKDLSEGDPFVLIYLPADLEISFTMTGVGLPAGESQKSKETVFVLGQGNATEIDDFDLGDDETDVLTISADGNKVGFKTSGAEKPHILMTLDSDDGSDYLFDLTDLDFDADEEIDFAIDEATGKFDIHDIGGKADDSYNLHIDRDDAGGEHDYDHKGLSLSPGETEFYGYDKWDGLHGGITVEEDKNSDGTIDDSIDESDDD